MGADQASGCGATGNADRAGALAEGVPQQHLVAPDRHSAVGLNLFHEVQSRYRSAHVASLAMS
jgi:hypothetical protein